MRDDFRNRRRGALDSADLILGVLLLLAIPALTFVTFRMLADDDAASQTVRTDPTTVAPDEEEVAAKLEYIEALYRENAVVYLHQLADAHGREETDYLKWAHVALQQVRSEASALRHLIRSSGSEGRFKTALEQIARLETSVQEGLRTLAERDHLGILRTGS